MAYHAEWHIPNRLVYAKGWGRMTKQDMELHTAMCIKFLSEAEQNLPGGRVTMIFDALEVESIPPLYLMLPSALPVLRMQNRTEAMIFVSMNKGMRTILQMTGHVMNFKVRFAASQQEALEIAEGILHQENRAEK